MEHSGHHMMHSMGAVSANNFAEVATALFLMALVGGFVHCSLMCGPFVILQNKENKKSMFQRLKGSLLIPYHLGRATTYVFLGVIAALFGSMIKEQFEGVLSGFLFVAGVLIIISTFPRKFFEFSLIDFSKAGEFVGSFAKPFFEGTSIVKRYFLGVILGFLPCGMVYSALAVATSSGDAFVGGVLMFIFAFGTFLPLVVSAFVGNYALIKGSRYVKSISVCVTVLVGAWLCFIALKPFL